MENIHVVLHGPVTLAGDEVGRITHEAILRLSFFPLLDGLALLHAGILLRCAGALRPS
jgi:hypothetical protein